MHSSSPSPNTPHWMRHCGPHLPSRLGGFTRAIALSLSGSSLLLSASLRRSLSGAAANSSAAATEKSSSLLEKFPFKAAITAGTLALAGDTLAQVNERRKREQQRVKDELLTSASSSSLTSASGGEQGKVTQKPVVEHDFVRALRMASYGFLLYGPLSQLWYQILERHLPGTALKNLCSKIVLNQVVLGPCVLLVVFAWNFTWMGRAKEIPDKYRRDFFPALVDGWKFWIPASAVNFGMIPLQYRVAYMSTCAIFWNFYLSSSVGKDIKK